MDLEYIWIWTRLAGTGSDVMILGSSSKELLELQQRAHSPQLDFGELSRVAAGLASESKNCKIPYSRCEALPSGRTFHAACCRELQSSNPLHQLVGRRT
jgi:hypothetical protein